MRTIPAGIFKNSCLTVMDEVQIKREPVLITKHGKPVAKLIPVSQEDTENIFGFYAGKIEIVGDVVSPVVPQEDWEHLK